jgi:ubiquinone/menaquinone biosynthesis C-methylase UbiE
LITFKLNCQLAIYERFMTSVDKSSNSTFEFVNKAFSKQSTGYDTDDRQNIVLQDMRQQVYNHVNKFIKTDSHILELNAGTGIDALHFAKQGYHVHATDLSDGMINEIEKKIKNSDVQNRLTSQQLSYDKLGVLTGKKFDYVFSNFGGLNCIDDLSKVTKHLPNILNPGAYVTWVIMPEVCLWELLWVLKGNIKAAFRRFNKNGVMAHLEGEYFKTYYFSLSQIKNAFGPQFKFIKAEGLCALSPPPSRADFPVKYPMLYKLLRKIDGGAHGIFPFNRWADHIIVTMKFVPLQ